MTEGPPPPTGAQNPYVDDAPLEGGTRAWADFAMQPLYEAGEGEQEGFEQAEDDPGAGPGLAADRGS